MKQTQSIIAAGFILLTSLTGNAYTIENVKWLPGPVSFYLELGSFNGVAAQKLADWNQYTGQTHLGVTTNSTVNGNVWFMDGRNSIEWSSAVGLDLPNNVLGVCSFNSLDPNGDNDGRMREADVLLNLDFASDFASGYYNIGRVLLHEIGHAIGLGHSEYSDAVMYPYISAGALPELTADDIAGARSLYGQQVKSVPDSGSTIILLGLAVAGLLGFKIAKRRHGYDPRMEQ
jgi:matrixin/protein with PEP-CTERM/exosortase system signal